MNVRDRVTAAVLPTRVRLAVQSALLVLCAGIAQAQATTSPRMPVGVYAKVDIAQAINGVHAEALAQHLTFKTHADWLAYLHGQLRQIYAGLLSNKAISGIEAGVGWNALEPHQPQCKGETTCPPSAADLDFSLLDDVFAAADGATPRKTVLISVTPGTASPAWVLATEVGGTDVSCDDTALANSPVLDPDCGIVSFFNTPELPPAADAKLPVPWYSLYVNSWANFLGALDAKYQDEQSLVAVAMAGPTAASPEMILPSTQRSSYFQEITGAPEIPADEAWSKLITNGLPVIRHSYPQSPQNPSYLQSDEVFIQAWAAAIASYEAAFDGITLIITPDSDTDLPEIGPTDGKTLQARARHNGSYQQWLSNCFTPTAGTPSGTPVSCEATTEVLHNFRGTAGGNLKAAEVGGLSARTATTGGTISLPGVKWMTTPGSGFGFLGGAAFDHAVTGTTTQEEGCPPMKVCQCPVVKAGAVCLTPDQAAANVLKVFFYGTPFGKDYGQIGGPTSALMQYLLVSYQDVQYAATDATLQGMLCKASNDLYAMARKPKLPC